MFFLSSFSGSSVNVTDPVLPAATSYGFCYSKCPRFQNSLSVAMPSTHDLDIGNPYFLHDLTLPSSTLLQWEKMTKRHNYFSTPITAYIKSYNFPCPHGSEWLKQRVVGNYLLHSPQKILKVWFRCFPDFFIHVPVESRTADLFAYPPGTFPRLLNKMQTSGASLLGKWNPCQILL